MIVLPRPLPLLTLSLILLPSACVSAQDETAPPGVQLFYRAVSSETNAPILPKTRSAWTQDRAPGTGSTGMSDHGFTEFPFCSGTMDFTFVENYAFYPRLISGALTDITRVNTADMVLDHVYTPDGIVWGLSGREFVQTFKATQDELVSITLMVASEPGLFRAALLDGGPGGPQIGPAKTFESGSSMTWGYARWEPGQAPLREGQTYGIRLWRVDGKPWSPFLHATGNAYDAGLLHVDDYPRPESDAAIWIVEQSPDLKRALIDGTDPDGWVYNTKEVWFRPRTANVRMISVIAKGVPHQCCNVFIRVYDKEGRLVAGPKYCLACRDERREHKSHYLLSTNEFPVTSGEPYRMEAYAVAHVEHGRPLATVDAAIIPLDLNVRVYGEPVAGVMPSIFNLTAVQETDSQVQFTWDQSFPAPTSIHVSGPGPQGGKTFEMQTGETELRIPLLWSGHDYDFRLTSAGPTGLVWRTPVYRLRMPRNDVQPYVQPEYPKQFVTLAPQKVLSAPLYPPIRYIGTADVANPGFEEGLKGWRTTGKDKVIATGSVAGTGVKFGDSMAGWSTEEAGQNAQVLNSGTISQQIRTIPDHVYILSAWGNTRADGGPRGDTRVRLFADPDGGTDFEGRNSSQWYWTDGRWMRFQHQWRAQSDRTTIGMGFFRWRDLAQASVHVDQITVWDLGPAPAGPGDQFAQLSTPGLTIADERLEADEKVEAFAEAPEGYLITGLGARGHEDNVTTIWLRVQPLLPDGNLGPAEHMRSGWEADAGLEAEIALPPGYVATGFGARAAPEWDVKSLVVWGRPLKTDGTLGPEEMFRGGIEPERGPEREIHLEEGRILTSAGLNMGWNDIDRIKGHSATVVPATALANR